MGLGVYELSLLLVVLVSQTIAWLKALYHIYQMVVEAILVWGAGVISVLSSTRWVGSIGKFDALRLPFTPFLWLRISCCLVLPSLYLKGDCSQEYRSYEYWRRVQLKSELSTHDFLQLNRQFSTDIMRMRKFDYYSTDHTLGGSHAFQMYCSLWGKPDLCMYNVCNECFL